MITAPRRRSLSPRITRHFEFTRLQDQLIENAYHTLIPIVSRPLERSRPRCGQKEGVAAPIQSQRHRTKVGGV
jgi:hypothetical protein